MYEERLMRCALTNSEKEKNKGRPNKGIKIMAGNGAISVHKWFVISKENRTIGHGNRLYKRTNWGHEDEIFQCDGGDIGYGHRASNILHRTLK